MIATFTLDTLTHLDKQYIKRIGKFFGLIDGLKKSRIHFIRASQHSNENNSSTFFTLAKERIAFIIQLQNQIQKYDSRIQELALKAYFENEDLETSEEVEIVDNKNNFQEKDLIESYRKVLCELPLPSHLELLLCKQLNAVENNSMIVA